MRPFLAKPFYMQHKFSVFVISNEKWSRLIEYNSPKAERMSHGRRYSAEIEKICTSLDELRLEEQVLTVFANTRSIWSQFIVLWFQRSNGRRTINSDWCSRQDQSVQLKTGAQARAISRREEWSFGHSYRSQKAESMLILVVSLIFLLKLEIRIRV